MFTIGSVDEFASLYTNFYDQYGEINGWLDKVDTVSNNTASLYNNFWTMNARIGSNETSIVSNMMLLTLLFFPALTGIVGASKILTIILASMPLYKFKIFKKKEKKTIQNILI